MKHPFSDWTIESLIDAATVYLPDDGSDWPTICRDAIEWLRARASEDNSGNGAWFAWSACDPIHIAMRAVDRHSPGYSRGNRVITAPLSDEFINGRQAGWCELLFVLNDRRMQQYIAKKKLKELGGAE